MNKNEPAREGIVSETRSRRDNIPEVQSIALGQFQKMACFTPNQTDTRTRPLSSLFLFTQPLDSETPLQTIDDRWDVQEQHRQEFIWGFFLLGGTQLS